MASVVLSGDTSGSVSLTVPAVAGTNTVTIPAETGTVLTTAASGVCRAWVNFNGTGTVAIRSSFNVSSITDNGTGDYTLNFTNALSDANYSVVFGTTSSTSAFSRSNCLMFDAKQDGTGTAPTTTSLRISSIQNANAGTDAIAIDTAYACVAIFR